jgi:tRNA nucleotidyltransferase (CCA-adding enzyme)
VEDLSQRIRALPGADRLLPALEGLDGVWLVGGAVRDLLLGAPAIDLDIAVEGDASPVARELAERLRGRVTEHGRFGTATVRAGDLTVDLAGTRRESYARPGALPDVEPAPLDADLARRDFTINAMAAALDAYRLGELRDPHDGRADLDDGVVRVLHPGSFVDDPTRVLRAVRYEARLGFAMDPETERLAREAVESGAMSTVSGPRIRDELLDMLGEAARPAGAGGGESPDPPAGAIARMAELGVDRALAPALAGARADVAAAAAQAAGSVGAQRRYAALAGLVSHDPQALADWVESLALRREDRDAVLHAARKAPQLVRALGAELPDSALHALLHCELPETLALAIALGAPHDPIARYLAELGPTRLEITGDDLRAAGVPESPALGRALEETLRRKLDGEVTGRDAELALALAIARGEGP